MKRFLELELHWQVLLAMISGVVVASVAGDKASFIEPVGTAFVSLLKMVIVPLIPVSIIGGVVSIGGGQNLGRLGLKTLIYYASTSFIACSIGLMMVNILKPGVGVNIAALGGSDVANPHSANDSAQGIGSVLDKIIPTNPVAAAANMDMLGLIFFSIAFGIALSSVSQEHRQKVQPFLDGFCEVMLKLTLMIVKLAPIGVFALVVTAINKTDARFVEAVGKYVLAVGLGLCLHLFIVLPFIYFIFTRKNPIEHFVHMKQALATMLATASSLATLPVTMRCVEEKAGVPKKISSFVLPLGATVNMDGTALFECVGAIFIAQVVGGVELSVAQQITVVGTALLASVGAAGLPSAGLIVIFMVLEAIGIQSDATVGVIIGTMLAIDRPLDLMRGMTNIFSDSIGAVILAKSENEWPPDDVQLSESTSPPAILT
jgi:proton glutamate symport protein